MNYLRVHIFNVMFIIRYYVKLIPNLPSVFFFCPLSGIKYGQLQLAHLHVDYHCDWRSRALFLRHSVALQVPMNPEETQTPQRVGRQGLWHTESHTKQNTIEQQTMRLVSKDTVCWLSTPRPVTAEPFDTLSIESMAQNNPETRSSNLNITFQCLLQ